MSGLTPAQLRVLRFLTESGLCHSAFEIEHLRFLEKDDVVVLPSLVELRLVSYQPDFQYYRITEWGMVVTLEAHARVPGVLPVRLPRHWTRRPA